MSRWEPGARGRLALAARELFDERGFDQTTVAEIAARAGVTERTFFRHYADKREVLFSGQEILRDLFVSTVAEAPPDAGPMAAVALALDAASGFFAGQYGLSRARQAVISTHPELQERELLKLASLAAAVAGQLQARGASESVAKLSAEAGLAVFRVAFERWVSEPEEGELAPVIRETLAELRATTAGF